MVITSHYDILTRKHGHKWFSAEDSQSEDWYGPHNTMEAAITECIRITGPESCVYIAQGRKLTKAEIDDMGVDYTWEVDSAHCLRVSIAER